MINVQIGLQKIVKKMRRNQTNFCNYQKTHGYENFTQLSSRLHLQDSNGTTVARLMITQLLEIIVRNIYISDIMEYYVDTYKV